MHEVLKNFLPNPVRGDSRRGGGGGGGTGGGHRVLIKRGPGNRGPSECGTTHEATSGMSS